MGGFVHLIIDVQNRYFNPGDLSASFAEASLGRPDILEKRRHHALYGEKIAHDIRDFAALCEARNIPNIYVQHGSAPADPHHDDALYAQAPAAGDRVVVKKGYDAFMGTGLKEIIDACGADGVILSGGVLGTCVHETGMSALQAGLRTIVAKDLVLPDIFDFSDPRFRFSEMEDWGMEVMPSREIPGLGADTGPRTDTGPGGPPSRRDRPPGSKTGGL